MIYTLLSMIWFTFINYLTVKHSMPKFIYETLNFLQNYRKYLSTKTQTISIKNKTLENEEPNVDSIFKTPESMKKDIDSKIVLLNNLGLWICFFSIFISQLILWLNVYC